MKKKKKFCDYHERYYTNGKCMACERERNLKESQVTDEQISDWLDSKHTDMDTYDPRDEMEDEEHAFGGLLRIDGKKRQNAIVAAIRERLKL